MSLRELFFFVLAITLGCAALWRSTQGQFTIPDSEPVFVAASSSDVDARQQLELSYGTFTQPRVPASSLLATSNLIRGRQVYAINCRHCHGGDGQAQTPAANMFNPPPKNLLLGAVRDVETVLRNGIAGTAMSAFDNLSSDDFNDVRDYTKYLIERGAASKAILKNNE
ncbi:MAG: mono/diheme cytochrome c family protein [Myxococcota bacterium]|jgi:mono/diheme cytochrome c family protein